MKLDEKFDAEDHKLIEKAKEIENNYKKTVKIQLLLESLMLEDIHLKTNPDTALSREEVDKFINGAVGLPFSEVARVGTKEKTTRFFCMSKGITFEDMEKLASYEKPEDLDPAFVDKIHKIGQDYFDMCCDPENDKEFKKLINPTEKAKLSPDKIQELEAKFEGKMDKIANFYSEISQTFENMDLSEIGNIKNIDDIENNSMKYLLLSGAQSISEQTLNMAAKANDLQVATIQKIKQTMKEKGQDFDNFVSASRSIDFLSQAIRETSKEAAKYNENAPQNSMVDPRPSILMNSSIVCSQSAILSQITKGSDFAKVENYDWYLTYLSIQSRELFMSGDKTLVDECKRFVSGDPIALNFLTADMSYNQHTLPIDRGLIDYSDVSNVLKMDEKLFKENIKAAVKEGRPLNRAEAFRCINVNDGILSDKDKQYVDAMRKGDFSHFEKMSKAARNSVTTLFMENHPEITKAESVEAAMNAIMALDEKPNCKISMLQHPLLRLGISQMMKDPNKAEFAKQLDEKLNEAIMIRSLEPISAESKRNLQDYYHDKVDQVCADNVKRQKIMAKTMLMAQLGGMTIREGEKEAVWKGSVANAFAHCSRVAISMPGGKEGQAELYQSLLGQQMGDESGVVKNRFSATHSVERTDRKTGARLVENKGVCLKDQYGMNVAIGGLGRKGITGSHGSERALLEDGSCGHMYMHIEPGDEAHNGGMLVGFESDAAYVTNQLGHTHDMFATGEKASSFGGQRTDEIGNKYGGRDVDLSGFEPEELQEIFDAFDRSLGAYDDPAKINALMTSLCGEPMDKQEMTAFLENIGIDKERAAVLATKGIAPELNQVDKENLLYLYENASNGMKAVGQEIPTHEQEDLKAKYLKEINELDPEQKRVAESLLEAYETNGKCHNQELEVAEKMGFAAQCADLLTDSTAPMHVRKTALQLKKEAEIRRQDAAAREERTKQYIEKVVNGENVPQDKIADLLRETAKNKLMENPAKELIADKPEKYEHLKLNKLEDEIENSKKGFFAGGKKNSKEFSNVLSEMRNIKELHDSPVADKDAFLALQFSYNSLSSFCTDYIDKHQNPRTQAGKDRLDLVKRIKDLSDDFGLDFENLDGFIAENKGKKWGEVAYHKSELVKKEFGKDLPETHPDKQVKDTLKDLGETAEMSADEKKAFKEKLEAIIAIQIAAPKTPIKPTLRKTASDVSKLFEEEEKDKVKKKESLAEKKAKLEAKKEEVQKESKTSTREKVSLEDELEDKKKSGVTKAVKVNEADKQKTAGVTKKN